MSLKRKCDFDPIKSSSNSCPQDESITTKYIKTDEFFHEDSPSSDERKYSLIIDQRKINNGFSLDESTEKHSISPNGSNSEETKIIPQRNRRKNHSQLKRLQPPPSSSSSSSTTPTKTSIPMILNLIDALVEEKQLDKNNDENLLLTIDSLISNLKHLREKIKTIHHDDSHPLNLSKPKIKQQSHEDRKSTTASPNFPLASTLFSSQPFFPPFAGKILLLSNLIFEQIPS